MRKSLIFIFTVLIPVVIFCQDKDCGFEKSKDLRTGKPLQVITTPTQLGKFVVTKAADSIYAFYSLKLLFILGASQTTNTVNLRIDSILFVFDDNSLLKLPANGFGAVKNTMVLKPQFQELYFNIVLDPSKIPLFTSKKILAFKVSGEKDAEISDGLNEKQRAKLSKAFSCFNSL